MSETPNPEPENGSPSSPNVEWHGSVTSRADRTDARCSGGATLWFTGLSGCGKSSLANAVENLLVTRHHRAAYVLDGDNLRHGLNGDLSFSAADRSENVRRVGEVALLLADGGAWPSGRSSAPTPPTARGFVNATWPAVSRSSKST